MISTGHSTRTGTIIISQTVLFHAFHNPLYFLSPYTTVQSHELEREFKWKFPFRPLCIAHHKLACHHVTNELRSLSQQVSMFMPQFLQRFTGCNLTLCHVLINEGQFLNKRFWLLCYSVYWYARMHRCMKL